MKAADLYRLMENPALLTEETLPQLKQIVDEISVFPDCPDALPEELGSLERYTF